MIQIELKGIDYAFAMDEQPAAVVSFKVSYSADELPLVGEFTVNAVVARKGDRDAMLNDARMVLHKMSLELIEESSTWAS